MPLTNARSEILRLTQINDKRLTVATIVQTLRGIVLWHPRKRWDHRRKKQFRLHL